MTYVRSFFSSDEELGQKCMDMYQAESLKCLEDCDSSLCTFVCLGDYAENVEKCPCSETYPNGCAGNDHSICTCKNPEQDNPNFIRCVAEANENFVDCNSRCGADKDCFTNCHAVFDREIDDCPCMENCLYGCPCDTGFSCEANSRPFITALCQGFSSSYINFSYSIAASGHSKEKILNDYL
jgi:hypothetical protein